MSLPETAMDYFVDSAEVQPLVHVASNGLGEPRFAQTSLPVRVYRGLLMAKVSRVWRDLGLSDDVDAVFFTDTFPDIPAGRLVLTCGGIQYKVLSREEARGLDGASSVRLALKRSAQ